MDEKKEPEEKIEKSEQTEKELQAVRQQMLRLQADFENARKRSLKIQAESQELANADLLRQLIEIYDDFQRALTVGAKAQDLNTFRSGVEMIAKRMENFLSAYGVTAIPAEGQLFDPARHEAVAHEVNDQVPESTVLEEIRKGYMMNGRVLRTAVVKVAVKPEQKEETKQSPCDLTESEQEE